MNKQEATQVRMADLACDLWDNYLDGNPNEYIYVRELFQKLMVDRHGYNVFNRTAEQMTIEQRLERLEEEAGL